MGRREPRRDRARPRAGGASLKGLHEGQPLETAGVPLGESDAVMILIHGRGAGPRNILDLVPFLDHPSWTYLAPAAANNTWYPLSFMAPIEQNEPWLSSALDVLRQLVDDVIAGGVPADRIVLLGFSQGACLAAEFCVRHPRRYGGVIVFSGGLVGPSGTAWTGGGGLERTPIFLGCSDVDAHIPKPRVDESAAIFERMGGDVVERIYPGMGHLVNDDEIAFARAVMDRIHNL